MARSSSASWVIASVMAAGCAMGASGRPVADQPVADQGGALPAKLAGVVYVNLATGERTVSPFGQRVGGALWSNSDIGDNGYQYHAIDGRSQTGGRATYNGLSVDWGDIDAGAHIDGVTIGYSVPNTVASRFTDPNSSNYAMVPGFNLIYAIWNNENGQHDGTVNEDDLALVLPFPDANGWVDEGGAWIIVFDLEGSSQDFDMLAQDVDGDGKVDFGFGYTFRQRQHVDVRNSPPISRGVVGPILVVPGNAGGTGTPLSYGVEDALDWYNTFDVGFTFNEATQTYDLTPNTTRERSNFVGTYFFDGDPYASYYTQLFGSFRGCQADFNGDGFVDFFDYSDFVECFETSVCPPGRDADVNGDAFVDFFDYNDFVSFFEVGC